MHPPPPALGQRRLPAVLRHHLARLLPDPLDASRPGSSRHHLQLLPRVQPGARAPKLALLSAFSILAPHTHTLFPLELTPKPAETHPVVTTGPWSSKDAWSQTPRPSPGQQSRGARAQEDNNPQTSQLLIPDLSLSGKQELKGWLTRREGLPGDRVRVGAGDTGGRKSRSFGQALRGGPG